MVGGGGGGGFIMHPLLNTLNLTNGPKSLWCIRIILPLHIYPWLTPMRVYICGWYEVKLLMVHYFFKFPPPDCLFSKNRILPSKFFKEVF